MTDLTAPHRSPAGLCSSHLSAERGHLTLVVESFPRILGELLAGSG